MGSIYRPNTKYSTLTQAEQFTQFNDLLLNTLTSINPNLHTILMGDTNLDALKYSSNEYVTSYIDSLFSSGFLQIITKPTRCTSHSATLIDHIITNSTHHSYTNLILTSRISDHFPVIYISHSNSPNKCKTTQIIRDFSQLNIDKFQNALSSFHWNDIDD